VLWRLHRILCCTQETWGLLRPDAGDERTVVAVAVARLGEPAEVARARDGGSFVGTGRALSAAAGRLSYVHGLKARLAVAIVITASEPAFRLINLC